MARKHKTVRNYSKKTKKKKDKKKNKTKHRVKKSITIYQDGGFPITGALASGFGAWAAKKASGKLKKISKEKMDKFMKWLLDSSMKALEETLSSVNYSSPLALKSMFNDLNSLLTIYKENLVRILKEDMKTKASELKLDNKLFKSLVDELSAYINKSKTLFHTSLPSIERQVINQQRYTDPSLTPDKPTGTSEFGHEYLHESFLPDTSVN